MSILNNEKWKHTAPKMGDHIRVQRLSGVYAHHGVYISDDEVIHFSGEDDDCVLHWSKCKVLGTSLAKFLDGGTVEVKIYSEKERRYLRPVDDIVKYARKCIGKKGKGYHLVFNNCEHFANMCTLRKPISQQVRDAMKVAGVAAVALVAAVTLSHKDSEES